MKTLAYYCSETGVITLRKIIDEQCLRTGCWGIYLVILDRKDLKVGENV